jgi:hypothetical protein
MNRGCGTLLVVGLAFAGFVLAGPFAVARETEEQLVGRIQSEQNPIKKAKDEIKLSSLQLAKIQDAYSHGRVDDGAKLLGTFMETLNVAWKLLHESGHTAARRPEGFRELEIALREDVRALQDLQRVVTYFDRPPIEHTVHDLEQMQGQLIHELFPGGHSRTDRGSASHAEGPNPATSSETR